MLTIIDYGVGNLASVEKAFEFLGCDVRVTSDPKALKNADAIVLPGVGAFSDAVKNIDSRGFRQPILESLDRGVPFLGICLGLQLLFAGSDENTEENIKGLDLLKGRIRRFPSLKGLKIPQIGWNTINVRNGAKLFEGIPDQTYFYFVHSYYLETGSREIIASETEYGIKYISAVEDGNIHAVQFHPEKSGKEGLAVLKNFIRMVYA